MYAQEPSLKLQAIVKAKRLDLHRNEEGVITKAYFQGSDEEFSEVCKVATLEELWCLFTSKVSDKGIVEVARLKKLRSLHVADTLITGSGIAAMGPLPELRELACNPKRDVAMAVDAIVVMPQLIKLDMSGSGLSDDDVRSLSGARLLEQITLGQVSAITDEALRDIGKMPNLKKLYVSDNAIGDRACGYISTCARLQVLAIGGSQVSDAGVEKLLLCKELEELNISQTRITARSLALLCGLRELRDLGVADDKLGDEIVSQVSKMRKLESLDCSGNLLSAKAIADLAGSRRWEYFSPGSSEQAGR